MKKALALLLAVCVIASLVACAGGKKESATEKSDTDTKKSGYQVSEDVPEGSYESLPAETPAEAETGAEEVNETAGEETETPAEDIDSAPEEAEQETESEPAESIEESAEDMETGEEEPSGELPAEVE